MKKKLLTILISALLVVVALPQTVFAEDGQEVIETYEEMTNEIVQESQENMLEDKSEENKTFKVTFYGNYEGSDYKETVREIKYSNYIFPKNNPSRLGFEFIGWYTKRNGGKQVTEKTPVFSDDNLYAHWKKVDAEAALAKFSEDGYKYYDSLTEALKDAAGLDVVYLLKDVKTSEAVNINETILDLNHHVLDTKGEIKNDGAIVLYTENYRLIKRILFEDIDGNYGAGEQLDVHYKDGNYIIPEGAFFTMDSEDKPYRYEIGFAFSEGLVWNNDVYPGTDLELTYSLILNGDITVGNKKDYAETKVEVTHLTLNDDVAIGGNKDDDANATLFIKTIDDDKGSVDANDHKIILNKTGKLVVSDDADFDEDIVVAGVDRMIVDKKEITYEDDEEIKKGYEYSISYHHFTNDEYKIPHNYKGDLEFVTNGSYDDESDVEVLVDDKVVDAEDYTLGHGSIHVTLHNDFIKTLKAGKHIITINVEGYDVISQTFIIKSKPAPEPEHVIPKTGIDF